MLRLNSSGFLVMQPKKKRHWGLETRVKDSSLLFHLLPHLPLKSRYSWSNVFLILVMNLKRRCNWMMRERLSEEQDFQRHPSCIIRQECFHPMTLLFGKKSRSSSSLFFCHLSFQDSWCCYIILIGAVVQDSLAVSRGRGARKSFGEDLPHPDFSSKWKDPWTCIASSLIPGMNGNESPRGNSTRNMFAIPLWLSRYSLPVFRRKSNSGLGGPFLLFALTDWKQHYRPEEIDSEKLISL